MAQVDVTTTPSPLPTSLPCPTEAGFDALFKASASITVSTKQFSSITEKDALGAAKNLVPTLTSAVTTAADKWVQSVKCNPPCAKNDVKLSDPDVFYPTQEYLEGPPHQGVKPIIGVRQTVVVKLIATVWCGNRPAPRPKIKIEWSKEE
jgi:hypothetical protein